MLTYLLLAISLSSAAATSAEHGMLAAPVGRGVGSGLVRREMEDIERAILDRMGPQLGGSSKNSSGELNSEGWPRNCSDVCAPYTAVIKEKGTCDLYSGEGSNRTCSSGYEMTVKDLCANLDKSTACYYCVAPERKSEMQTNVLNNLNFCKAQGVSIPDQVEGIDMSKVSAGQYAATVSAGTALVAMVAGLIVSLV